MSIKYFPDRVFKKNAAAIDRVMAKRAVKLFRGSANVSATALDETLSSNGDWQVNSIKFTFNNATARNYSVKVASGVKVLTDLNDSLWFQTPTTLWQKIVLSQGFYTGTELAAELQTQMNANTVYTAAGLTFTVAYAAATGLFTITPSTSTLKYLKTNTTQRLPERDSLGGHLFGLNADTALGATVVSDTAQFGLDTEAWIVDETGSVVTEHYNNDIQILSLDQSLHLESSIANTVITYEIAYEEIV